jgi:hypothetical protein
MAVHRSPALGSTRFDGVAGYCYDSTLPKPPGAVDLYWLTNPITNDNFYTSSTEFLDGKLPSTRAGSR